MIPDPEFLHFSSKHKLAYSLLDYAVSEQNGITLITGEIGSGKTTLLRHLFNQLNYDQLTLGFIDNTHESWGDLATWIATALNIDCSGLDKAATYKKIKDFVIQEYAAGKRVLIVVDEAQNMSEKTLEELRLFTNINMGTNFLLQIILVGQPELLEMLQKPSLTQIAQRISVEYHLEALSFEDTHAYIKHRLSAAGGSSSLFDELAIEKIFQFSGGIPRLINVICDNALVYAYAQNLNQIGFGVVMDVVKTRRVGMVNRQAIPIA
jgi:general secretion pathway protein A